MKGELPPKQAAFVREYLIDLNATQAYLRAGYKCADDKVAAVCASQLLSKPKVSSAVQKAMDKRAAKVEVTAEYVLSGIKTVVERCLTAEPVRDKEGNKTGEWTFQAGHALKGYELLGKHIKLFSDVIEVKGLDELRGRLAMARKRATDD